MIYILNKKQNKQIARIHTQDVKHGQKKIITIYYLYRIQIDFSLFFSLKVLNF
jgi:hypothetical protein